MYRKVREAQGVKRAGRKYNLHTSHGVQAIQINKHTSFTGTTYLSPSCYWHMAVCHAHTTRRWRRAGDGLQKDNQTFCPTYGSGNCSGEIYESSWRAHFTVKNLIKQINYSHCTQLRTHNRSKAVFRYRKGAYIFHDSYDRKTRSYGQMYP